MNRAIKFRGLRTDGKGWVYGGFIHNSIDCPCIIDNDAEQYEVTPESVGQFTGLYDKNGVEIYEGDKLKHVRNNIDEWLGIVKHSDGAFRICPNGQEYVLEKHRASQTEIIGNIHESEVTNG